MARALYPELTGKDARRRIAEEREAEEAFASAVTRREEASIVRTIGPAFRGRTTAEAARAEQRRVREIIERDRSHRITDALRDAAEMELREGVMVNLSDAVVPPTPEWLSKGPFENFTPRQAEGTVRTVTTVRRIKTPLVERMARRGQISEDGAKACRWYAETYERAGLEGLIPSVDIGREVFAAPHSRTAFTEAQSEAQSELRLARKAIAPRFRKFFDAIVLHDLPINRAARFAQMRRSRALAKFRDLAEAVADVVEALKGVA